MVRRLASVFGFLCLLPMAALVLLALAAPVSPTGLLYVLGSALVVAGALSAPWRRTQKRGVARVGVGLLAATLCARLVFAGAGATMELHVLPGHAPPRLVNRVLDEQDVTLVAARLLVWGGRFSRTERATLLPALRAGYAEMRAAEGLSPSPVASTYLGRERPEATDTLVIEPARPRFGVVFLHGFAGNFAMPCWAFAQAVRPLGGVTVCPSVGVAGNWRSEAAATTAGHAIRYLRMRGVARVYLAGLSNGAVGASELAPRFAPELAGLVLVSGVSGRGRSAGLPVLVVHGTRDSMASAGAARAFAQRAGARGTYAGFRGGHFVLVERSAEVRGAIRRWFQARE